MGQGAEGAGRPVGYFTEAGLEADDAAEGGGNADGAAGIGAQRQRSHAQGHCHGAAAAGATRGLGRVPGVVGGAVNGVVGNAFPAQLGGGGFTYGHKAVTFERGYRRRRLVQSGVRVDGARAALCWPPGGEKDILDAHRYTIQQALRLAALVARLCFPGKAETGFPVHQAKAIGMAVEALDLLEHGLGNLHG